MLYPQHSVDRTKFLQLNSGAIRRAVSTKQKKHRFDDIFFLLMYVNIVAMPKNNCRLKNKKKKDMELSGFSTGLDELQHLQALCEQDVSRKFPKIRTINLMVKFATSEKGYYQF